MNKLFKWTLILCGALFTGCSDDVKNPAPAPGKTGDDVVFKFPDEAKSRTMYGDIWYGKDGDKYNANELHWGNYITTMTEQIRIYCRESVGNAAVYNVKPQDGTPSNTSIDVTKAVSDQAIQWGKQGIAYNFYAFYPASQSSEAFVGDDPSSHVIQAQVLNGQVPPMYMTGSTSGPETASELETINKNNTPDEAHRTHIYAMPDMEAAIMMAKTTVDCAADPSKFGQPVSLDFNVLADVLDITINGPITPNLLNGNGNPSREFIQIRGVDITGPEGVALAGTFKLNMDMTDDEDAQGNKRITPVTAVSTVQVATVNKGLYPTLFIRSDKDVTNTSILDQLHIRAFLMPGQITDLSQLKITVRTDCGVYDQQLESDPGSMPITGKIYPIKLPHFNEEGQTFNYAAWMGQLDKNIYVTELSIPGAWHASNPVNQGTASADLQTLYDKGIRAFEVHTANGKTVKKYRDLTQNLDVKATDTEFFPDHLNQSESSASAKAQTTPVVDESTATNVTSTSRDIKSEPCNVVVTKTVTYDLKPRYSLRLYRTRNVSAEDENNSLSDALIALGEKMNSEAFMFFEFGMDGEQQITLPLRTVTETYTQIYENQVLSGTQSKQFWASSWGNATWDYSGFTLDESKATVTPSYSYDKSLSIDGTEAWPVAIESCLARLQTVTNAHTGESFLFQGPFTTNTTLGDVRGQVLVKVNTNGTENEDRGWWSTETPALFSRWVAASASEVRTINAQWGAPIAPTPLDESSTALHWCYSELDNVGNASLLADRKTAINSYLTQAYNNYKDGLHRTFFLMSIGGYYKNWNATGCKNLAKELNPYMVEALTDPTKQNCPFGIVFMNYAIPPTGEEATYRSDELIRTVINNNSAFIMNRRPSSESEPTSVKEKTNSSFNSNPNNPLK